MYWEVDWILICGGCVNTGWPAENLCYTKQNVSFFICMLSSLHCWLLSSKKMQCFWQNNLSLCHISQFSMLLRCGYFLKIVVFLYCYTCIIQSWFPFVIYPPSNIDGIVLYVLFVATCVNTDVRNCQWEKCRAHFAFNWFVW